MNNTNNHQQYIQYQEGNKNMEQDNSFVHSTLDGGEDIYITDQWKRKYHFRIASFPAPTGLAFEAYEGWRFKFQILDTYDDEK